MDRCSIKLEIYIEISSQFLLKLISGCDAQLKTCKCYHNNGLIAVLVVDTHSRLLITLDLLQQFRWHDMRRLKKCIDCSISTKKMVESLSRSTFIQFAATPKYFNELAIINVSPHWKRIAQTIDIEFGKVEYVLNNSMWTKKCLRSSKCRILYS